MSYPRVGVSAAIINSDNRILLTRRSSLVWEPGKWCLPGGHFEPGETWIKSVEKEISEETGLVALDPILIGVYSEPALNRISEILPNGDEKFHFFVVAAFVIHHFRGEVKLNEESDLFLWASVDDLPTPLLKCELPKIQDAFQFSGTPYIR